VAPAFVRPRLRGWGLSVVESIIQSINQFLKTKALTFEVLDEFKLDIFKVHGFNNAMLTKEGTDRILKRTALANQQKNFQNALTMDTEDDHQSKQLNFSGIAETKKEIRIEVASDLKIPMTKLFGQSASGFNSGEDDIEVYNGMLESEIRSKAKKPCREVAKLRCIELFGFEPDDLEIEFKPLRVLSHEQEESVKDKKMGRIVTALDKGIMSTSQAQEAINRDNLLPVKLDITEESLLSQEEVGKDANLP
jgi:phage-related protein (TIGR01555 family)